VEVDSGTGGRQVADKDTSREEELRRLLTDAIEVQLAALKAGIGFWTEWIEQTSEFVNTASKTLSSINTDDSQTRDVLLELVDAGRASARSMTEIPRHTATRFIEELDRFEEKKKLAEAESKKTAAKQVGKRGSRSGAKKAARSAGRTTAKKTGRSSRPKRAGRVKE
jgi:hypothetical protein